MGSRVLGGPKNQGLHRGHGEEGKSRSLHYATAKCAVARVGMTKHLRDGGDGAIGGWGVEGLRSEDLSYRVVQRGPVHREGVPKKYNLEKSGGEFSTGAGNFSLHWYRSETYSLRMPLGLSAGITTAKKTNVPVPAVETGVLGGMCVGVREYGPKRDQNKGESAARKGCAGAGRAEAERR